MAGGSRALPDLVSRIRVDASGVDAAINSLIHGIGRADFALAGLSATIGLVFLAGKSMYDEFQKQSDAEANLAQAVASHNSQIGNQSKKSAELAKAQKELSAVKRQLYEYDLAHHAVASKTSDDLKGHAKDLKAAERASKELAAAQTALENWDLSHTGHVLNAAQLRQREHRLAAVAAAQRALAKASGDAATMDTLSTKGHKLTALELAKRQDLLDKLAEAQQAVNDETNAGGAGAKAQVLDYDQVKAAADQLIATNRRYISDQTQVYDGYGKLIRSGLSLDETQRVLNDAIDLAAIKHITLAEAVDILSNAEHGRMRGLIDLGITTKQLTDSNGNLLGGQRAVAAAMKEVDAKVAHGRDTLSDMQQATNELGNHWHTFAIGPGAELSRAFTNAVQIVDIFMALLEDMGHNNPLWDAIQNRLVQFGNWVQEHIILPLLGIPDGMLEVIGKMVGASMNPIPKRPPRTAPGTGGFGKGGRAGGGPVMPNGTYRVGEEGEELLVMGARGGYVIPNGGNKGGRRGSGDITIHVHAQTNADPYQIATEVGWEVRKLRRTG